MDMLPEVGYEFTVEPCILVCILGLLRYNRVGERSGGNGMANEKRYMAQKRQRRRRKTAKAKMKLYEQGKTPHDKLPSLAKRFLRRKMRALRKAE